MSDSNDFEVRQEWSSVVHGNSINITFSDESIESVAVNGARWVRPVDNLYFSKLQQENDDLKLRIESLEEEGNVKFGTQGLISQRDNSLREVKNLLNTLINVDTACREVAEAITLDRPMPKWLGECMHAPAIIGAMACAKAIKNKISHIELPKDRP